VILADQVVEINGQLEEGSYSLNDLVGGGEAEVIKTYYQNCLGIGRERELGQYLIQKTPLFEALKKMAWTKQSPFGLRVSFF
jgi:hypothetical protein